MVEPPQSNEQTDPAKTSTPPRAVLLEMTLRAFRHRNFRLFFVGQFVSLIGTWMQSVAQAWLVYRLTGSSVLLGIVGFASQFPVFVLAPLGGSLADRRRRLPMIIVAQALMMVLAFALAGLTLSDSVRFVHVVLLSSLLGVVNAFEIPARQSFLVELVGREDLMNAIALNSMMFNGSRIVGPAVAGLLVAAIGEGWCFFLNGLSFLAVLAGLLAMRLEPRPPVPPSGRSTLSHMGEGFAFVAATPPIRALLLLLGLISLAGMPYAVLMPIIADRVLHGGPFGMGVLMGASGIGALLGAGTLASREGVQGLGRWVAIGASGFGLSLFAFSMSRLLWLSSVLMFPVGYLLMLQMAASNTLIQSMVPDRLRGRVMAVYSMMIMGMAPVGALLAGFLATKIGATGTIAAGGVACVFGGVVFSFRLPSLRAEGRVLIAQQSATELS